MDLHYIETLVCPYCRGKLHVERVLVGVGNKLIHAVIQCPCYRYPLIDGILILKQQSAVADTEDERVSYLDAGEIDLARSCAMQSGMHGPTWEVRMRRLARRLIRRLRPKAGSPHGEQPVNDNESRTFARQLQELRPGLYGDYLYQRYANNSFLASVPPLLLFGDLRPGERVLELACGIGHSAYLIHTLFPQLQLVATDHDFVNLVIARTYFVPDATLLCLDAEAPLPFGEESFGAIFCLDGFHYLRAKVALVKELDRVAQSEAIWAFPHLHNRNAANYNAGIPLAPTDYQRCFAPIEHRIYDEANVLNDFHRHGALSLDHRPPVSEVEQAPNLTLIGSRRKDFWRRRTDLAARLCNNPADLLVNPIYRVSHDASRLRLAVSWPTERLHDECRAVEAYLPNGGELDADLLARAWRGTLSGEDMLAINELARQFVLVNLPRAAYGAPR